MNLRSVFAALHAALLCILLAASPAGSGSMTLLWAGKAAGGGGGCSQATTLLARYTAAGGALTGTEATAMTTMVCGLVTDGLITGTMSGANSGAAACGALFDAFYIYAVNNTTNAALNLCGTSYTLTINGAPAFSANVGWTGIDSSATVFLDTGYTPFSATTPNMTLNSAHVSCWILSSVAMNGPCVGIRTGSDDLNIYPAFLSGGNVTIARVNESNANGGFTVSGSPKGFYIANRSGTSASQIYQNGVLATSPNTTSTALPSNSTTIYGLGYDSGGAQGSGYQQSAMTIGASLSGPQAAALNSRICTYLTAVNGAC